MRFACEAVFLVLVAVGAALMDLRPLAIIILMACAWLLVALIERASSREPERIVEDVPEPVGDGTIPAPAVAPVAARDAYRWLFWRRARDRVEALPSPTAPLEERPARAHVRRIERPPEPAPVEPVATAAPTETLPPEPEPPPGPAVTKRPLDLPGLEVPPPPEPAPPQRPRFLRPRQPAAPPPPPPPQPREWNLWDLERRAKEQAGNAPRDEEWSALFTHLRVFANADGMLPKEFDELVRESFGELIEAA